MAGGQTKSNALQANNIVLLSNLREVPNAIVPANGSGNFIMPNTGSAQVSVFPGNAPVTG
jgi:hypothetical protein